MRARSLPCSMAWCVDAVRPCAPSCTRRGLRRIKCYLICEGRNQTGEAADHDDVMNESLDELRAENERLRDALASRDAALQ